MLRDELRVLEISVWLENLQALRAGALKLEADLRTAQEDRQRAQDALDAVYAAGEESLAKIQANDVRAEELRGQASGIDAQAQQESSAIAVLENSLSHDRQTLERLDRELADTQQRAGNLQEQADALTDRMAQIDRETEDLGSELSALMESLQAAGPERRKRPAGGGGSAGPGDPGRGRRRSGAHGAGRPGRHRRPGPGPADGHRRRQRRRQREIGPVPPGGGRE